jgi:hypothetical protein
MCDSENCWYLRHDDDDSNSQSDHYAQQPPRDGRTTTFWHNANEEKRRYCDMCADEALEDQQYCQPCSLCGVQMLGTHITHFPNGSDEASHHYCSRCIPRDDIEKELADQLAQQEGSRDTALALWIRATGQGHGGQALAYLVHDAHEKRRQMERHKQKQAQAVRTTNEKRLCEWVPSFAEDGAEKERVLKRMRKDALPPFQSATELLLYLLTHGTVNHRGHQHDDHDEQLQSDAADDADEDDDDDY